jgi:hypothetical protein
LCGSLFTAPDALDVCGLAKFRQGDGETEFSVGLFNQEILEPVRAMNAYVFDDVEYPLPFKREQSTYGGVGDG